MTFLSTNDLKKKLDEKTICFELLNIVHSLPNFESVVNGAISYLLKFFECEEIILYLIREKDKKFDSYHASNSQFSDIIYKESNLDNKFVNELIGRKESFIINQGCENHITHEYSKKISRMFSILKSEEKTVGLLGVFRFKPFTEYELHLLDIAATQLVSIIKYSRSIDCYRAVIENALDGVIVIGEDDRLNYVNERAINLLGYKREELIGKDFKEFLNEEGKKIIQNQRFNDIEEETSFKHELIIVRKNGEIRNVEVSSTIIRDSDGSLNIIAFLKDITEKKKIETQILQAEKLRAIAELTSGVAHDFNNALSVILGNIQLLKHSINDSSILETLNIIEKVAMDSSQIVSKLQDFTKNKPRKALKPLNINTIVRDAVMITQPKWKNEAQGKGIHIDVICDLEEIPLVMGNESELREGITNIIFNAIEAMPRGGRIDIKTFSKDSMVYIQIKDTGIGMNDEVRKRVFEPFFTTKPYTNTGLGLSMSYGIIKSFGGDIEVESELGKGSSFIISLPQGEVKKISEEKTQVVKSIKKARILVIEDEELVRNVLFKGLSNAQHQVTIAKDGMEGIALFKKMEFDIVLTDLGMPNVSGWEVCKTIKDISPHTPIGMITGWEGEIDYSNLGDKGPDFILAKPFDLSIVIQKINESLINRFSD